MNSDTDIAFLKWALPKMGYQWDGFRKPRRQVLKRVCNRMKSLGLRGGYNEYKTYLENHPEEWHHLDRLCYVTISKFFRDRKLWDYIRDHLLPKLLGNRGFGTIEIWSAGCCNGEEPYSIAIIADMVLKRQPLAQSISILATDRYSDMIERAQEGSYPAGALKELTTDEIEAYFTKPGNGEKEYKINQKIIRTVELERRDIRKSIPDRLFDLVFCRNLVFTYFTDKRQEQFLQQLKPHLKPGSHLIIGSNETLPPVNWLEKASNSYPVYRKKPTAGFRID